jgi:hypothetical protein
MTLGNKNIILTNEVHTTAQMLMYRPAFPKVIGPGVKFSGQMISVRRYAGEITLQIIGMQQLQSTQIAVTYILDRE